MEEYTNLSVTMWQEVLKMEQEMLKQGAEEMLKMEQEMLRIEQEMLKKGAEEMLNV